jgi:hypothetical protein
MLVQFDKKWYTPKEVGEIIGKSAVSVSRLFKGKDGAIDIATEHRPDANNRAHLRISADALQRFINERAA